MTEFCWSLGKLEEKSKDLLSAINVVTSKGLNARVSTSWPPLDLLFAEGSIMGYRGDLSSFSSKEVSEVKVYSLIDEEVMVELEDKDYIKLDSLTSLISLINEVVAREALVIRRNVFPVLRLLDPSSVSVDLNYWESFTVDVSSPPDFLLKMFKGSKATALNIVSITDRWSLDVIICDETIMGSVLYMPESVETIYGADAFVYPLQSPGKWIITSAKPLLCPKLLVRLDPKLEEVAASQETGVVKA